MSQKSIGPLAAAKLDALIAKVEMAFLRFEIAKNTHQEHLSKLNDFCKSNDVDFQALVSGKLLIDENGDVLEKENHA